MTLWLSRMTHSAGERPPRLVETALREAACALPLTAAVYVASGSLIAGVSAAVVVVFLRRVISALRAPRP